jgi:hypothetical protein
MVATSDKCGFIGPVWANWLGRRKERRDKVESQNTMHQHPPDEVHISVIVPAYNMEVYVEQCLRSLFDQTIDRLEVIVVDDGSTDRTREVVESLTPPEGKSLRVITKPNGGLSSARNAGMKAAQGRWIGFVDADDWVAGTMYALLISEAESAGAEVAIARNVRVDEESGAQMPADEIDRWNEFIAFHGRRVNPRDCPDLFLLDHSPCKRICTRTFLERIGFSFAEGLVFEDLISSFQVLCQVKFVILIDQALYFYRVGRPGQIISRRDASILQFVSALSLIIEELWNCSATTEMWANFIYFQCRMLLYLTSEIMDEYRECLVLGCAKIARKFPPQGLTRFREKFRRDTVTSTGVELQLYGNYELFAELARTRAASERAEKVANSDILRRFFVVRAQMTSRLARMSARRRQRGAESGSVARRFALNPPTRPEGQRIP